jgi:hypothetical protein
LSFGERIKMRINIDGLHSLPDHCKCDLLFFCLGVLQGSADDRIIAIVNNHINNYYTKEDENGKEKGNEEGKKGNDEGKGKEISFRPII